MAKFGSMRGTPKGKPLLGVGLSISRGCFWTDFRVWCGCMRVFCMFFFSVFYSCFVCCFLVFFFFFFFLYYLFFFFFFFLFFFFFVFYIYISLFFCFILK